MGREEVKCNDGKSKLGRHGLCAGTYFRTDCRQRFILVDNQDVDCSAPLTKQGGVI